MPDFTQHGRGAVVTASPSAFNHAGRMFDAIERLLDERAGGAWRKDDVASDERQWRSGDILVTRSIVGNANWRFDKVPSLSIDTQEGSLSVEWLFEEEAPSTMARAAIATARHALSIAKPGQAQAWRRNQKTDFTIRDSAPEAIRYRKLGFFVRHPSAMSTALAELSWTDEREKYGHCKAPAAVLTMIPHRPVRIIARSRGGKGGVREDLGHSVEIAVPINFYTIASMDTMDILRATAAQRDRGQGDATSGRRLR